MRNICSFSLASFDKMDEPVYVKEVTYGKKGGGLLQPKD